MVRVVGLVLSPLAMGFFGGAALPERAPRLALAAASGAIAAFLCSVALSRSIVHSASPSPSARIPPHPLRQILHRILQLELRLEPERPLGPAQIRMMVAVRQRHARAGRRFELHLRARRHGLPIAAANSLGVVIAPMVRLNTPLPKSFASSASTVPRAASFE